MHAFPDVVDLTATPDALSGHVWLFESVTGLPLRFSMGTDGRLTFGDDRRRLDDPPPTVHRPAVRSTRTRFRRDALREAVDDVTAVTVFGVATCYRGVEYDWDRLPTFLATDVRSGERLLAPDAMVRAVERLGLTPAPAVEKERRSDAFDPGTVAFPTSEWGDRPVAGLLAADKSGGRGRVDSDAVDGPADPGFTDAAAAAAALVTDDLAGEGDVDRAVDAVVRRNYGRLAAAGVDPDDGTFRGAVAQELGRRV